MSVQKKINHNPFYFYLKSEKRSSKIDLKKIFIFD